MATLTKEKTSPQQGNVGTVMIDVRNVVKRFTVGGGEVTILKDISFQIKRGEFVAIVGPSGSGKSTLLNMFTGIDRPSEGQIEVGGTRLDTKSEGQLARWRGTNLGLIFQFFQLLPALSLLDNIVLPMDFAGRYSRKERRGRALHLLETVGLSDQVNKLPGMVSGGQQQRAAIARALANDPPLLVGDEPTGNLDTVATEQMFQLFLKLVDDGKTVVMVTHNLELAHRTQRVMGIADGRIVRDERPKELVM